MNDENEKRTKKRAAGDGHADADDGDGERVVLGQTSWWCRAR